MVKMSPEFSVAQVPDPALRLALDAEALAQNWHTLDRLSGAASAGAAIKANAYGIGARRAVPILLNAGCRDFFVAHWGELADLTGIVDPSMVSVLHGPITDSDAEYARRLGAKPVINSLDQARRWNAAGGGRCDLMIDTGMNRLGVALHELSEPILQQLDVDVLLSHLIASEEDNVLNGVQQKRWVEALAAIPHARASLANSGGIMLGAAYHGDLTRPGIALYGGIMRSDMCDLIRQVVRPEAAVIQVHDLNAGDVVGYNATFTAPSPMRVATVGMGYADGYLRSWSGKGLFRHGNAHLPVLGRISMDMVILDVAQAPHLREGDWVAAEYALPFVARMTGLSQYEALTVLGARFTRQ